MFQMDMLAETVTIEGKFKFYMSMSNPLFL